MPSRSAWRQVLWKHLFERSWDRGLLLALGYALLHFFYTYWSSASRPGVYFEEGWYAWWDQSLFIRIAGDLAHFRLPDPYNVGLGYPLMGAIFYRLAPDEPFVVPNLLLYLLTIAVYYRIARQLVSAELALVTVVLLSRADMFLDYFVEPWSNAVTITGLSLLLYVAVFHQERVRFKAGLVGLCLAWVFAARYGDMFLLVPLALVALWRLGDTLVHRWETLFIGGAVAAVGGGLVLLSHYVTFGSPFATPYSNLIDLGTGLPNQSWQLYRLDNVSPHIFSLFINPHVFARMPALPLHSLWDTPVLGYYFVLCLSAVGMVYLLRWRRGVVLAWLVGWVVTLMWYGSFGPSTAYFLRYHTLRYFAHGVPLLLIAAIVGLVELLRLDVRDRASWRPVLIGVGVNVVFVGGLYLAAHWFPEFPDYTRLINNDRWWATSNPEVGNPNAVFDDNMTTGWHVQGPQTAGDHIDIDLQEFYLVDTVYLLQPPNGEAFPRHVTLSLSPDGEIWQPVQNLTTRFFDSRNWELGFTPTEARRIRIAIAADSPDAEGWGLHEVYVYGEKARDHCWRGEAQPDWVALQATVEEMAAPGDLVILDCHDPAAGYYLTLDLATVTPSDSTEPVTEALAGRRRLWLIDHLYTPPPAAQTELDRHADQVWEWQGEHLRLVAYDTSLIFTERMHPVGIELGGVVRLLGYRLSACDQSAAVSLDFFEDESVFTPGSSLCLTLYWQAEAEMDASYTVFTHLLDDQDHLWAQQDNPPVNGTFWTPEWRVGEVVVDQYELAIDPGAPPGVYRLQTGMYDLATMQRLPAQGDGGQTADDTILLTMVTLSAQE